MQRLRALWDGLRLVFRDAKIACRARQKQGRRRRWLISDNLRGRDEHTHGCCGQTHARVAKAGRPRVTHCTPRARIIMLVMVRGTTGLDMIEGGMIEEARTRR